jgi:hypothetical protein|tara:strand:- start:258 stop:476 length:219 start_codon:yes stop_codon:yes gene_type:complete
MASSVTAFAPSFGIQRVVKSFLQAEDEKVLGSGGMADTRDPETVNNDDPRKSISAAPSFEEYLKQREAEAGK